MTPAQQLAREYEMAQIEFARREAEDRANGVVRKWDGTNGKTTAEVLARLREHDRQAGGGE